MAVGLTRSKRRAVSDFGSPAVTGFVTDDFKTALLQDADLFVLPSYYENFGIY